jgi:hypothetical protein
MLFDASSRPPHFPHPTKHFPVGEGSYFTLRETSRDAMMIVAQDQGVQMQGVRIL